MNITAPEIDSINQALLRFRKRLDDAKAAVGWGIGDWFFDLFYIGGSPRADVRDAALGGEILYRALASKRDEIIAKDDIDVHEQVLSIVEIANRAARWDRAESIEQYRNATDVSTQVGKEIGDKLSPESLADALRFLKVLLWVLLAGTLAIIAVYVYPFLPKKARG